MTAIRYILKDKDIRHSFGKFEIPNETTLKAFAEDKSTMPKFHSIEELQKDLLGKRNKWRVPLNWGALCC